MARINCSVDSCTYWGKGDVCEADSIMVQNNMGRWTHDMEIGTMGDAGAGTSAETMCETFKQRAKKDRES